MDDPALLKARDLRDLTQEQLDAIGLAFVPPLPVPATSQAILAHQRAHGAFLSSFFPVLSWSAALLSVPRLHRAACAVAGMDEGASSVALLLQWRATVTHFSEAMSATLALIRTTVDSVPEVSALIAASPPPWDEVARDVQAGRVTDHCVVAARLGSIAGAMFARALVHTLGAEELAALEQRIAQPSRESLRRAQLQEQQRALEQLQAALDLQRWEDDGSEERAMLRTFQSSLKKLGRTPLRAIVATPRRRRQQQLEEDGDGVAPAEEEEALPRRSTRRRLDPDEQQAIEQPKDQGEEAVDAMEEEEDENQVEGEAPQSPPPPSQMQAELTLAKWSTAEVLDLVHRRGSSLPFPDIEQPDPGHATAQVGAALAADRAQLQASLSDEVCLSDVEGWGVVLRWWRVVQRCFTVRALLEHLRDQRQRAVETKKRQGRFKVKTLKQAWSELVHDLRGCQLSYSRASVFDRVGCFLIRFPGFIFQMHWVSLDHWAQQSGWLEELEAAIMEDAEQRTFWSSVQQLGTFHLRVRPSGHLADGSVVAFRVEGPATDLCTAMSVAYDESQTVESLCQQFHLNVCLWQRDEGGTTLRPVRVVEWESDREADEVHLLQEGEGFAQLSRL